MQKLLFLGLLLSSVSSYAADLICSGQTTEGQEVEASIALRDGEPEGSLTLKINDEASSASLKRETFVTKSTTFDIAMTSFKYWIVELNDSQGLKRGVLVARNSNCSSRDAKCEENSELALDWNASYPYRLRCVMR
ncbi:MAG: hypothetical protein ABIR96_02010 [Bdellovibrionota bacterium]